MDATRDRSEERDLGLFVLLAGLPIWAVKGFIGAVKGYIAAWPWPERARPLMHELMFVTLLAIAIGLVAVESAAYPLTSGPGGALDAFVQFRAQLATAALAIVVLLTVPPLSERTLKVIGIVAFVGCLSLMVYARLAGGNRQGNYSWTPWIGPIPPFQPSEIAKVGFAMVAAFLLGRSQPRSYFSSPEMRWYMIISVTMALVLCAQRDLGMLMVFALLFLIPLFLSGFPVMRFLVAAASVVGVGTVALLLRRERVDSWLRPMEHLDGAGYHIMNCKLAIARGAGLGLGIGQSPDKWYALPYPHTDSIFCVWAAETGLWGTALLLGIFAMLAWCTYKAACQAANRTHWLLATSCGFLVCTQAAVNMAVATNLVPPAGLTLPFISYGRTSLLGSALAMAVVLWVARRGQPEPIAPRPGSEVAAYR